ncbi:hypothetical protein DPMN_135556 [Dreissena polymorpha]|uniref:Uncharacterized protein n=1 Tax=Dreissena polymorpha TaxID=45954 RepID=A0A9D4G1T6_DREPO|nr:hypothetical protein DPMN_135556 [Dreissena polymorpha]
MPVAVKMVTRHQREVRHCIEKLNHSDTEFLSHRAKCFMFSNMKLMKEILMLEQLSHPGFIKLLGYCVRNEEIAVTTAAITVHSNIFESLTPNLNAKCDGRTDGQTDGRTDGRTMMKTRLDNKLSIHKISSLQHTYSER